jgi:undecaprenyl-diphosphatase
MLDLAATLMTTPAPAVVPALHAAPTGPGLAVWHGVVLGLVEGITEYLPISSTGHLIITTDLLQLERRATRESLDAFNVVIQGGAILAVAGLYWPRFVAMLRGLLGRDPAGLAMLRNLAVAFTPAALLGLWLHRWLQAHLFNVVAVSAALIAGGVFMIAIDRLIIAPRRRDARAGAGADGTPLEAMSVRQALIVGLMQVLSLVPGTSRSMSTICGGVIAGLRPAAAAEFSFLLGMPTLLAAGGYSLYRNLRDAHDAGRPNLFQELGWAPALAGLAVATIAAALAIRWLVQFLTRRGLTPFGVYRIALGLALIALVLGGRVTV